MSDERIDKLGQDHSLCCEVTYKGLSLLPTSEAQDNFLILLSDVATIPESIKLHLTPQQLALIPGIAAYYAVSGW